MKPLASLLFVAVIILGVSSQCPSHWTFFQEKCYRFGDTPVSWPEAEMICQTRGAKLAEASSSQENDFLKFMAREKIANCVWVGGDDIFHEGTWEWTSTSTTFTGFRNWADGQPNNGANTEDCLVLFAPHNYAWNDAPCTNLCNFICSTPSRLSTRLPTSKLLLER